MPNGIEITMETIKERIKEIINKNEFPSEGGGIEVYLDYNDRLNQTELYNIMTSDNPRQTFNEMIDEYENDYAFACCDELFDRILEEFSEEENDFYNDNSLRIWDWVHENYYFYYNRNHFNTSVNVNLMLDTGDCNYDFTCNNVLNWDGQYNNGEFDDDSSILWLARQQGKEEKLKEICKYVYEEEWSKADRNNYADKFIKSVVEELENLPCHMSTLTFLLKMDLFDYFDLREAINAEKELNKSYTYSERKGTGYITVSKDTMCGLFNPWSGNGSMLEIELDKDVEIPFKAIFAVEIETGKSNYGYSVDDVYGLIDNCWKETVKEIKPMEIRKETA